MSYSSSLSGLSGDWAEMCASPDWSRRQVPGHVTSPFVTTSDSWSRDVTTPDSCSRDGTPTRAAIIGRMGGRPA
ncbi:hypothetical protein K470DRAFT_260881 [Piedraia hortae CBS 480.64]|uniref:Uncharacterized protein n=1 Tax=Piedraia hortae CBS 480.64 TaxID=1314780 RepID=A0A6A7BPY9_9PEZI|nr:hypothetical protein K470DRAFT_260881 [Piedraia hortae CBS 480.64]